MITKNKFNLAVGLLAGACALLSAPAGHWVSMGYDVTILAAPALTTITLTLIDKGGADPNFVLNALDVRPDTAGNSSVGQIQFQRGAVLVKNH